MAHGYPDGKYRGGNTDRSKKQNGPGKNAKHGGGKGAHHSQKAKGNKKPKGGGGWFGLW